MKKREIGRAGGLAVEEVVLQSADAAVAIISYGCIVRDWRVDSGGRSLPVVLGFPKLEDYVLHSHSHGAICGRIVNRISNSRFLLDGVEYPLTRNHGEHHLHGGATGLGRRAWQMETDGAAESVRLSYSSPDGEEGYPGAVDFSITWRLEGPRLICEMSGTPDRRTPVNLANHSYYNLGGGGDVRDHVLWVDAKEYTPLRPDLIPDGRILPVEGTMLDFAAPRSIADSDPDRAGLDNNLILNPDRDAGKPVARVSCPRTGLELQLWTDQPALQLFVGAWMTLAVPGHEGQIHKPFAGLCLEAQQLPDSPNNPDWPSIVCSREDPYFQQLVVEISH
jgi:aldose 1-epimerase